MLQQRVIARRAKGLRLFFYSQQADDVARHLVAVFRPLGHHLANFDRLLLDVLVTMQFLGQRPFRKWEPAGQQELQVAC